MLDYRRACERKTWQRVRTCDHVLRVARERLAAARAALEQWRAQAASGERQPAPTARRQTRRQHAACGARLEAEGVQPAAALVGAHRYAERLRVQAQAAEEAVAMARQDLKAAREELRHATQERLAVEKLVALRERAEGERHQAAAQEQLDDQARLRALGGEG